MQAAQVLVFEADNRLTQILEEVAAGKNRWLLRHPRGLKECLEMLGAGWPSVLVVRLGRDVEEELTLVSEVAHLHPDAGLVVAADETHAPLAGLAWDLGADYVLILPQPRELVTEIVARLLPVPAEK
jgi:hypothetical protein